MTWATWSRADAGNCRTRLILSRVRNIRPSLAQSYNELAMRCITQSTLGKLAPRDAAAVCKNVAEYWIA